MRRRDGLLLTLTLSPKGRGDSPSADQSQEYRSGKHRFSPSSLWGEGTIPARNSLRSTVQGKTAFPPLPKRERGQPQRGAASGVPFRERPLFPLSPKERGDSPSADQPQEYRSGKDRFSPSSQREEGTAPARSSLRSTVQGKTAFPPLPKGERGQPQRGPASGVPFRERPLFPLPPKGRGDSSSAEQPQEYRSGKDRFSSSPQTGEGTVPARTSLRSTVRGKTAFPPLPFGERVGVRGAFLNPASVSLSPALRAAGGGHDDTGCRSLPAAPVPPLVLPCRSHPLSAPRQPRR